MKHIFLILMAFVFTLLSGCGNSNDYYLKTNKDLSVAQSKELYFSNIDLFDSVTMSIILDSNNSIYKITPFLQEVPHGLFQKYKAFNGLYWCYDSREIVLDVSYAEQTKMLFLEAGLICIHIDHVNGVVVFELCRNSAGSRMLVYTESGDISESRWEWIECDEKLENNWFIGIG